MAWTEALTGLAGIAIGAALTHLFGRAREHSSHYRTLRTQAYLDLVRAVAAVTFAQRRNRKEEESKANETMADALARTAILGTKSVLDPLAQFLQGRAVLDNPDSIRVFVSMFAAMRSEHWRGAEVVSEQTIRDILFHGDH